MNPDTLREIVSYDPDTGRFTYKKANQRRRVGDPVGTLRSDGYWEVTIRNKRYRLHRLAWLLLHGSLPTKHIDHINGDRADNRACNLREASYSENQQNLKRPTVRNKCGYLGVSFHRGRFVAQIKTNGKNVYIGRYKTAEEAHRAYIAEKIKVHSYNTLK